MEKSDKIHRRFKPRRKDRNHQDWNLRARLQQLPRFAEEQVKNYVKLHADISEATWYNFINGKSKLLDAVVCFAEALGVSIETVMDNTQKLPTPENKMENELAAKLNLAPPPAQ